MNLVQRLIEADRKKQARILVVGDAMRDLYVHGHMEVGQEGCPKFVSERTVEVPGGAANASNSLIRWNAIGIQCMQFNYDRSIKSRFIVDGRCVFRHDTDIPALNNYVDIAAMLANAKPDAVLISDYDKGFLSLQLIRSIIDDCNERGIPIVCDAKREPDLYEGSIIKCNLEYADKFAYQSSWANFGRNFVITRGPLPPYRFGAIICDPIASPCVSHVGAGDCFAAHLALALAHGFTLEESATIAYASGSVYVAHQHNRAPYPHEISRILDPHGGKVVSPLDLPGIRHATDNGAIFANGVWRLPHAGHAWLLRWAKQQGSTLVVGINDDASAKRLRPGQFVLPLAERIEMLAAMDCVDYIVPFSEDTPESVCQLLKPAIIVKGSEYAGMRVPGQDHAGEVRFAPVGPYNGRSATTTESEIVRGRTEWIHGE